MKVTIIGTGYVGLISGLCIAKAGHTVICVDKNEAIVSKLNRGEPTIHEEGLLEILQDVRATNHFTASTDLISSLHQSDIAMIAVGTPDKDNGIDLSFISGVAKEIGSFLKSYDRGHLSVVVKSTVIPGTTDTLVKDLIEEYSGKSVGQFGLGMNPEFLREGSAIYDFDNPDRIVIGYEDEQTMKKLKHLYSSWDCAQIFTNSRTAEFLKYSNNCLLATQISIMNELANLSSAIGGINFDNILSGIQTDKRWNPISEDGSRVNPGILSYLSPGCGFGGSCFPKDLNALNSLSSQYDSPTDILQAVITVNKKQPFIIERKLSKHFGSLKDKKILMLGLSFKPETDDVRESAALKIAESLVNKNADLHVHDPIAANNFLKALPKNISRYVTVKHSWQRELENYEIIVLVSAWEEYLSLNNIDLTNIVLFDTKGVIINDSAKMIFKIGTS
jgi:UDPglucose 6-dehydrogenase/GDP-mannose 6-dehydrogenase